MGIKKINPNAWYYYPYIRYGNSAQTGRWEKEISGKNWSLWLDKAATFYYDDIYLPPVNISALPVNPPTCGWDKLHNNSSLKTVSSTGYC